MRAPTVIKLSGHEIDDPALLTEFADVIAQLKTDTPIVIVHGGGKEITTLQTRMGIEARYVDGIRVTDAESLALVEMALCGVINKRLVRVLVNAGVDALGLSGVDRGLIRAARMTHPTEDMGYSGTIKAIRVEVLADLLDQNITPVFAPICLGTEHNFNVNADQVAGALAASLNAERLVFISNIEGVLVNDAVVPNLTAAQTEALIADGTIFGGMIPKVRTALDALTRGVAQVVITNLHGLKQGGGTAFTTERV